MDFSKHIAMQTHQSPYQVCASLVTLKAAQLVVQSMARKLSWYAPEGVVLLQH